MSVKESTDLLRNELKQSFGDKIEVKYVDTDEEGMDDYPIMEKVMRMGYPFPITFINGEPKYAGKIMVDEIKNAVNDKLKD
ncbi:hypothetical protein SYNTR_0848 [Candidatus Syntrophocurvum alkaliphilum]|uniref:Thioredoxin-like fold domain-containing protein n=1 Tax=Candidatus Syntrophocurvum alkaliphilum TaxID=2293317 RepID=A0A6I6DIX0_9FIRM|nr:hypothetical protein [Candidatus Syntrophocurvum alkaliphilum]QGT99441.1 hypothetical protein SYNTR_0848 [Candidatus Syntrophocurvum alkaliphilum]